jgi:hypothetical protein
MVIWLFGDLVIWGFGDLVIDAVIFEKTKKPPQVAAEAQKLQNKTNYGKKS